MAGGVTAAAPAARGARTALAGSPPGAATGSPAEALAVAPSRGFRAWKNQRPFWGATLSLLAGLAILWMPLHLFPFAFLPDTLIFLGYLFSGLVIATAVAGYLLPSASTYLGILVILFSIVSIFGALGGLFVGTLLGILGGSLMVAWQPKAATAPAAPAPGDPASAPASPAPAQGGPASAGSTPDGPASGTVSSGSGSRPALGGPRSGPAPASGSAGSGPASGSPGSGPAPDASGPDLASGGPGSGPPGGPGSGPTNGGRVSDPAAVGPASPPAAGGPTPPGSSGAMASAAGAGSEAPAPAAPPSPAEPSAGPAALEALWDPPTRSDPDPDDEGADWRRWFQ